MWTRGERNMGGPLEMEHIHCSIKDGEWLLVLPQSQRMRGIRAFSLSSEDIFATPILDQSQFPGSRLFCGKKSVT